MLGHLFHTVECLVDLAGAFETEGNGDDTHGEDTHLLAHTGDDGSRTCSGSATHTGRDERHAGAVVEHVADILDALLSSLARPFGTVAGSESLTAELQMHGHGTVVECLVVGVAQYERYVVNTLTIHVVDGIAATSSHTNHLDDAVFFFGSPEVYYSEIVILVCHDA